MGNCQAVDVATLVIQHPSGKVERFYSSTSANQVMKTNPGHYVALIISTTTLCQTKDIENCPKKSDKINTNYPVRLTRIKLLKPTDTLVLGQVYRLITTQEVMKGLREKKQAKRKQNVLESDHKPDWVNEKQGLDTERASRSSETEDKQVNKTERYGPMTTASTNNAVSATAKTRFWQPSLQSISEAAS